MKSFAILALSAVALAAPLQKRAEPVYVTHVEEVYETVFTTTTVYVDPTDAPKNTLGAFYEEAPAPVTSSSVAAPVKSEAPVAKPQVAAPVASPSPAPYVAPAPVEPAPAPAPSSKAPEPAYVAPAVPSPAPAAPVAPAAPAAPAPQYSAPAAPAASPASGGGYSSGGKGDHTGDLTYYDVEVGLGSCGTTATTARMSSLCRSST